MDGPYDIYLYLKIETIFVFQELFEQSFLTSGIKFKKVPPILILQMPRLDPSQFLCRLPFLQRHIVLPVSQKTCHHQKFIF